MLIKGLAQQLADIMVQYSQKHYGENWFFGIEYELWYETTEDNERLSYGEVKKVRELAEQCEGWIIMNNETKNLEFVSIDQWKKMYIKNKPF